MKTIVLKVNSVMANFGLDPIKMIQSLRGLRFFIANYFKLKKQLKDFIGKDILYKDENGHNFLHHAVMTGNNNVVKILLDNIKENA